MLRFIKFMMPLYIVKISVSFKGVSWNFCLTKWFIVFCESSTYFDSSSLSDSEKGQIFERIRELVFTVVHSISQGLSAQWASASMLWVSSCTRSISTLTARVVMSIPSFGSTLRSTKDFHSLTLSILMYYWAEVTGASLRSWFQPFLLSNMIHIFYCIKLLW